MVEVAQASDISARHPARRPELPRPLSLARATATVKSGLPLRRTTFDRQLEVVVREVPAGRQDFYVPDYAARRALRQELVIDVDPAALRFRLKHRLGPTANTRYLQDKFVGGGNWSDLLEPLSTSSTHREVKDLVAAGYDYRSTPAYLSAMRRACDGDPVRRNFVTLKTPALVESYFRLTTELCRSIDENGVVRRADCRRAMQLFRHPRVRLPWVELMESDIGMAIGATGELYRFGSGKHRTAAAQALRLKSMPVEVRMVHLVWLRRQVAETGLRPADALLRGLRGLASSAAVSTRMAAG